MSTYGLKWHLQIAFVISTKKCHSLPAQTIWQLPMFQDNTAQYCGTEREGRPKKELNKKRIITHILKIQSKIWGRGSADRTWRPLQAVLRGHYGACFI